MNVKCKTCDKEFDKRDSQIARSKTGNHFCSKSCAASFNNKGFPKRKAFKRKCSVCNTPVSRRSLYCEEHSPNRLRDDRTIKEVHDSAKYQKSARIRALARTIMRRSNKDQVCQICGYDKHVEVCHIHPIKDFPEDTSIKEVNQLTNLIYLCPNHHWELDNGILDLSTRLQEQ